MLSIFNVNQSNLAAGQRCMALSVGKHFFLGVCSELSKTGEAILVGEAQSWLPELVERAQKLKVSGGFETGADL